MDEQKLRLAPRCSEDEKIADKISEIILRSRSALGLDHLPMSQDILDIKVEEFCKALAKDIPLDRLEEIYLDAMSTKDNSYDLAVTELNQAWLRIKSGEFKPTYFKCIGCLDVDQGRREICPFHKKLDR